MENIAYWKEVGEFRKQLKKVIIPFEKFFRTNESNIKSPTIIDEISKIEI
ncbi:MAG: hypothetical protein ACFE9C_03145 [Candidatus Hodarchaeota archaeon]